MGLFVKICGIASGADAEAVAELSPDALGFNFWPGSPRYVLAGEVAAWVRDLPAHLLRVGIFVDAAPDEVDSICEKAGLQVAQLHGRETPAMVARLHLPAWKVVHLDRMTVPDAQAYAVDAFLVDSYSAAMPGGTGKVADWPKAAEFVRDAGRKVILAGGLTPLNVGEAIERVHPWGVDVSSGVEAAPGKKDLLKVKDFIETCRNF